MFSFLIYDKEKKSLFGSRDHFGIKQTYYIDNDDLIAISSEYKSIIDIVPSHIVEKRKLGFPTPIKIWMKQDLGQVVRNTINKSDVEHIINKNYAINLLDNHIKGINDNSRKVWTIFTFCLWHQIFMENKKIKF